MKVFCTLLLMTSLAAAGVAGRAQTTPEGAEAPPQPPATVSREERERLQKVRHLPEAVRQSTAPVPKGETSPLPEFVRSMVLADAARLSGSKPADMAVIESVAVTWPDGSMGCPEQNMYYPQLPLPGYRVVVLAEDKTYDYRIASPPSATEARGADAKAPPSQALQMRLCDPARALDPLRSK